MGRWPVVAMVVVLVVGCRVPPDRDDLKLFDEKRPIVNYPELYLRARSQSNLALEAFYTDSWLDLDEAAKALEQTARFLPKAPDSPADIRTSEQLQADATRLGEAARAKDIRVANEVLQRIQYNIRTLRPKEKDAGAR